VVALQIVLGFINLILLAPGWMQLLHLLVADGLWLLVLATGAQALAEPRAER
jgi:heme A synthase